MTCNGIGMIVCHCGGDLCVCGVDGSPGCEEYEYQSDVCDWCEGIATDPRQCSCGYVENVGTIAAKKNRSH
jgi:hypothetical protein